MDTTNNNFFWVINQKMEKFSFDDVIKQLTGYDVLPFDPWSGNSHTDIATYHLLTHIGNYVLGAFNQKQVPTSASANEVGILVEELLLEAFSYYNINASSPKTENDNTRSSGYPDMEFENEGEMYYLESKAFNVKNSDSTLRTFYFSPSQDYKITRNSKHLLFALCFTEKETENSEIKHYQSIGYHILDLKTLSLSIKFEFNASNKDMYGEGNSENIVLTKTIEEVS